MAYKILMDVSGDICPEVVERYDIRFIPMDYSIGDEMRTCVGIESAEVLKKFYDGQRAGDLTKTSQITPFMYEEYMSKILDEGDSILYLCLSGGLSSTFQSANVAKASLEEKYPGQKIMPLDTLAATGGMGVLAERAGRNMDAGMSLEENYADLSEAVKKLCHWFFVQDLMYLKRGGRVSAATAVVGTMLNVKPVLKIDRDGRLINIEKKRGNKAAQKYLLDQFRENYDPAAGDVIYIIDADAADQGEQLETEVRKIAPEATVRRMTLCPIIGAHTGPGMSAICHMGKNQR